MSRILFLISFMAVGFTAWPQQLVQRPLEEVDASLAVDREVIEGLATQAERLRQAAMDVMSAPGARFTAEYRYGAAEALSEAAERLEDKVKRLRAADERLEKAVESRATARREVREAIGAVANTAREGVFEELERTPDPLPELLIAKQEGIDALAAAEVFGDRLVSRDTLVIGFQLLAENPAVRDTFLIAVTAEFARTEESTAFSTDETGYTEVIGLFPEGADMDEIRGRLLNALKVESPEGDVTYLPALVSVAHDWRNGTLTGDRPLRELLSPVIEGDSDAMVEDGSGD